MLSIHGCMESIHWKWIRGVFGVKMIFRWQKSSHWVFENKNPYKNHMNRHWISKDHRWWKDLITAIWHPMRMLKHDTTDSQPSGSISKITSRHKIHSNQKKKIVWRFFMSFLVSIMISCNMQYQYSAAHQGQRAQNHHFLVQIQRSI